MSEIIMETCALTYRYPGGNAALASVDVRVTRHRKLAVLGANGSGKTTLFMCLNGLLRSQTGHLLLHGQPVGYGQRELTEWRRQVGLVFQDPDDQVVAGTVMQDLALGPLNLGLTHAAARQRALETMAALGITDFKDRPTHELSHGERKLVAIAGVLAMHPEVIVLDEPTAGLDPVGAQQVLQMLEAINRRGATLVISTHDMDLAYEWADDAVILAGGRVFRQGPVQELLADPKTVQEARLRQPWILEVVEGLRKAGVWPRDKPSPRSRQELFAQLRL